jgi:CelD/BcsL family acetyltransferase involved in cellulose biosynthesis
MTDVMVSVETDLQAIGRSTWNSLWTRAEVPSIFARYEWVEAWWETFGKGCKLRVYTARVGSRLVGILPTSWPIDGRGDVVLLGDEHSDYAGILTEANTPGIFRMLIEAACSDLPRYRSLLLRDLRSDSPYALILNQLSRDHLSCWLLIGSIPCPRMTITPKRLQAVVSKESLRRHARKLEKLGDVTVRHFYDDDEILPRLEMFFNQHVERWAATSSPSLFLKSSNRTFYQEITKRLSGTGLLLYTEITLDGAPIACHFGFISEGDLVWYKPTYELAFAKLSPGNVLLRELFLLAGELGLSGFDFTRGVEAFKLRFADQERNTLTYIFYGSRVSATISRTVLRIRSMARKVLRVPVIHRLWRLLRN